jgi:hypothetical protein
LKKYYCLLVFSLFCACHSTTDTVVAEIYNKKLYLSEVKSFLPSGLTAADSAKFANQMIEEWIKQQILLYEANKVLTEKEKNFGKEITQYRKNLLIQAYYQKITADTSQFSVNNQEVKEYMARFGLSGTEEQDIVKLNYIKLAPKSKVKKEITTLLFDTDNRRFNKRKLEELCADSLEYFLDDNTWIYLNEIEYSLPIDFKNEKVFPENPKNIEKCDDRFCYLIVLLDRRTRTMPIATSEDRESIKAMLIQEKKTDFLNRKVEELYLQAIEKEKIIR